MATLSAKIRDTSWLRQVFLVPSKGNSPLIDDVELRNASFSSARFKFANTSLGGSLAINPPPQYTPNADRRVPGLNMGRDRNNEPEEKENQGTLGRYYSEAIDDNSRIISMRFGVPEFNSLSSFFTGFYNYNAGLLARTGRATGIFYTVGKAAGFVVSLVVWPLMVINFGSDLVRYFLQKPRSKYYYLKPTMPLYWNAVTALVNTLAVNKGVIPRVMDDKSKNLADGRFPFSENDLLHMSKMMGDVIMENGQINVYAMATRYQRQARKLYAHMQKEYLDKGAYSDTYAIMEDIYNHRIDLSGNENPSLTAYMAKWLSSAVGTPKKTETPPGGNPTAAPGGASDNTAVSSDTESAITQKTDADSFFDFLEAELDDGSQFVSFRVDNEGGVSESFSNQTGDSELAMKINSMSGQSRETTFNLAGGNISDGVLGKAAGALATGVKDFIGGIADGLNVSGIAALGGAAFVDIPKHWTSSTANLPRMNYTMTLSCPYGNKMSQLMFIYVPMCMILAAALPLSTGKQSYTSPFLVQLFDRGRAQTRLGIIDSLSITRGTTHLGFNNAGAAMSVDVSFSIQDLSSIMHMPLSQGWEPGSGNGLFDDDTVFSDYMAILGSLTLNEQTYPVDKLRLRLTNNMSNLRTWFSSAHFAQWITDLAPMQLISAFYPGRVNR